MFPLKQVVANLHVPHYFLPWSIVLAVLGISFMVGLEHGKQVTGIDRQQVHWETGNR